MAIETYVTKSNGHSVIPKDPNANLDYAFDWTKYLDAISDTIAAVEWTLDSPLLKTNSSFDSKTATVWISGGVIPAPPTPNEYRVTCRITTAGGRIDDRSIFLKIAQR